MNTTITNFTPQNLDEVRKEMQLALKQVEDRFGVTFNLGKITYGSQHMKMPIECAIGSGEDAARIKFERDIERGYGHIFDLTVEDYGQKMLHNGKEYTIVGLNTRARTKPLQMVDNEGKEYVVPVEMYKKYKLNEDGSVGASKK